MQVRAVSEKSIVNLRIVLKFAPFHKQRIFLILILLILFLLFLLKTKCLEALKSTSQINYINFDIY